MKTKMAEKLLVERELNQLMQRTLEWESELDLAVKNSRTYE